MTAMTNDYKVVLNIIRERELLMSDSDFKKKDWFPNYIILCKPIIEGENDESVNSENKLNGILGEMKVQKIASDGINENIEKLRNDMGK